MIKFFQAVFLQSEIDEEIEEIDSKTLIKIKFLNFMKVIVRLFYIFVFLRLWNKTLMYLKYSFISLREYDTLIRAVDNKNKVIANAAKQLIDRKPNRCKNERQKQQYHKNENKKVFSSHF